VAESSEWPQARGWMRPQAARALGVGAVAARGQLRQQARGERLGAEAAQAARRAGRRSARGRCWRRALGRAARRSRCGAGSGAGEPEAERRQSKAGVGARGPAGAGRLGLGAIQVLAVRSAKSRGGAAALGWCSVRELDLAQASSAALGVGATARSAWFEAAAGVGELDWQLRRAKRCRSG
jgi:hypothetical protein